MQKFVCISFGHAYDKCVLNEISVILCGCCCCCSLFELNWELSRQLFRRNLFRANDKTVQCSFVTNTIVEIDSWISQMTNKYLHWLFAAAPHSGHTPSGPIESVLVCMLHSTETNEKQSTLSPPYTRDGRNAMRAIWIATLSWSKLRTSLKYSAHVISASIESFGRPIHSNGNE